MLSVESEASSNGSVVRCVRECGKKYWIVSVSDIEEIYLKWRDGCVCGRI